MEALKGHRGTIYTPEGPPRPGGQARVWRATDPAGRPWAVKVALDAGIHSERLERERAELERLVADHPDVAPSVVRIVDHGVASDGCRFLVMPWYELNLEQWAAGRSLEERLLGAERACEAVARLHRSERDWRKGVVHRDVKPQNFLVRGAGDALEVVLADFGGVKRVSVAESISVGTGIHTPGFAPPEQTLPLRTAADPSWDVYALAVTVFWLAAGRRPTGTDMAVVQLTPKGFALRQLAEASSRSGHTSGEWSGELDALSRLPVA